MNLFMMYNGLMGYDPKTISKPEFVEFYLKRPKAIEADKKELQILEHWIELHRQAPTKETFRKVNCGLAFLIDQYPLEGHAKRELNEVLHDVSLLGRYSVVDTVVGELLVGLHRLTDDIN